MSQASLYHTKGKLWSRLDHFRTQIQLLVDLQGGGSADIDINVDEDDFTPYATPFTTPMKQEAAAPLPLNQEVVKKLFDQ